MAVVGQRSCQIGEDDDGSACCQGLFYVKFESTQVSCMGEENIMKHIRIEDVHWLCSLSESELDLLISLKQMVLQRAKPIGHESLAKKFDLKMLRALGFILLEHLRVRLKDSSSISGLGESFPSLDGCSLLKHELDDSYDTTSIEVLRTFFVTERRKRKRVL
ncbi:hypothetical protein RJ640_016384 [Escallonia rubra]|uniref:Uncharacterized protein n=1 Tax=Escallonia rubra TaxID=112253 RepID=A0AA88RBM0_9ASTE|nr:hypothetical protein RJ640_016384 [Escallonia rubra]